jgi:hypothetical protein
MSNQQRCARCERPYPEFPQCPLCDRRHEEFGECVDPEELVPLSDEQFAWVRLSPESIVCPECLTQAEEWAWQGLCSRCGADEPGDWDEERDGEWLRITAEDGVCPDCWTRADAEAEAEAISTLAPILASFGARFVSSVHERSSARQRELERLQDAGPEDLLKDAGPDG